MPESVRRSLIRSMLLETQQKKLKGHASAGLASLVLFAAYSQELISAGNPAPLTLLMFGLSLECSLNDAVPGSLAMCCWKCCWFCSRRSAPLPRNQRNYGRDCKADYGRADIVTKATRNDHARSYRSSFLLLLTHACKKR